jgi:hypothetical protein
VVRRRAQSAEVAPAVVAVPEVAQAVAVAAATKPDR